ncbi:MAG: hypothetical protein AABZ45_10690, partial [Pseudomonadota bacterium]
SSVIARRAFARRGNPDYANASGLLRHFIPRNDEGGNNNCVSLIPQLCKPQAAVVSPVRRINQT